LSNGYKEREKGEIERKTKKKLTYREMSICKFGKRMHRKGSRKREKYWVE
jgi:hypothetical protein